MDDCDIDPRKGRSRVTRPRVSRQAHYEQPSRSYVLTASTGVSAASTRHRDHVEMVTSSAVTDLWRRRATPRRTPLWRRPFSLTYRMAQPNTFENPRRGSGDAPQVQGRVLAVVVSKAEKRKSPRASINATPVDAIGPISRPCLNDGMPSRRALGLYDMCPNSVGFRAASLRASPCPCNHPRAHDWDQTLVMMKTRQGR